MQHRSTELTAFLTSLHRAIAERAQAGSEALAVIDKIMQALEEEKPPSNMEAGMLPLCSRIDEAVQQVATHVAAETPEQPIASSSSVLEHTHALQDLSPQLRWWHRPDAQTHGEPFASGHANATVIGKGGLEERDDVWVGISLLAPDIEYPEHHHPPEEVYLVMSHGHWQKSGGDWFEPGIGGLVHNPPDIRHAMRSGSTPLLATWCLWNPPA